MAHEVFPDLCLNVNLLAVAYYALMEDGPALVEAPEIHRAYELLLKEAANLIRKEAQDQMERTTSSSHHSPTHKRQLKDAGALLRSETAPATPPSRQRLRSGKRVVPTPRKFTRKSQLRAASFD
ncbi:hypothetical protein HPB52_009033 [Rhipicephalus sanguineus]|uniref:Uncharacterized protein n=1 Tax=Rhipicephalus sanguineus TaxID=34632 RepID=A0A9D4QBG6_RHISA|nr:hypothetical protein HPB52_009033 [Rhipicephalus sanguineus]